MSRHWDVKYPANDMSKHTPGKWEVQGGPGMYIVDPDGVVVASASYNPMNDPRGPRTKEEREANARLIAAAPEMLEALRDIVEQYEATGQMAPADLADSIRVFGKAAIAKAEGREA